jgi:hypothetical protein
MDTLKFHSGPQYPKALLRPKRGPLLKRPYGLLRVGPPAGLARPQGGLPAAVFYPFELPTPHAYVLLSLWNIISIDSNYLSLSVFHSLLPLTL